MPVDSCAISVVMPVYNTAIPYLEEAVNSILTQTFQDFEFIIVDDGSIGETRSYLDALKDPRIRLIRNPENIGVTKSLNIGLRAAKGKYIARMDGDDVSFPDRLEKEYAFMEEHPDVIICGSKVTFKKTDTTPAKSWKNDMDVYRIRLVFTNPGPIHPTIMIRREALLQHGIEYDENYRYSQDYALFMKISEYGKIVTLPEKLLFYRKHKDQINQAHRAEQIKCDQMTQEKLLCRLLDCVSQEELDMNYRYSTGFYHDAKLSRELLNWYRRLIHANDQKRIYPRLKFRKYIFFIIIRNSYKLIVS